MLLAFVAVAALGAWQLGGPSVWPLAAVRAPAVPCVIAITCGSCWSPVPSPSLVCVFLTGDSGARALWG